MDIEKTCENCAFSIVKLHGKGKRTLECLHTCEEMLCHQFKAAIYQDRIDELQTKLDVAMTALKFYADKARWETIIVGDNVFDCQDGDFCDAFAPDYENNKQDSGDRARQALKEIGEK